MATTSKADTMKAAVLEAPRCMRIKPEKKPEPGPGEALVRVAYCGVCGSDVPRYLDGAVHAFPLVLGHEFSGQIESVGQGVDPSLVGLRVAGIPLVPCMECPDCRRGDYSLCKSYSFIGSRQPGAYAQYVCVPAANVFAIADEIDDFTAAFFEPASVAQHAVNHVDPRVGATAVVVGCGTIGIFTAQILQSMGLEVVALARRDKRIKAAQAAGVKNLCDTSSEGWLQTLVSQQYPGGFDYVFDTSGSTACMVDSFALAANRGVVCMIGTPKRPISFEVRAWENLNRKELTVTGTWMSYSAPWPGREWEQVAESFAKGRLKVVDDMVDSVFGLSTDYGRHLISDGMEKFAKPNNVSGKILVDCR